MQLKKIRIPFLALALAFAPFAARAEGNALIWTKDGYRSVAMDGQARGLQLIQDAEEVDGIVVGVGARFTLLDREANTIWSNMIDGDGTDKLSQALPVGEDGWIAVGASSSSDLDNGWHEGWYDEYEPKTDGFVARISAEGEPLWTRCYGGTDWDSFSALCPAPDGGWILVGETVSGDGDVSGRHASGELFDEPDAWVVHIDDAGEIVWQKLLGGSGADAFYGVFPAGDGYLAVGTTNSPDGDVQGLNGQMDGWAVRLDAEGNILSQACYGGEEEDYLTTLAQGPDGTFLAGGYTWSGVESGSGYDAWVVALDRTGAMEWEQRFGNHKLNHVSYIAWAKTFWAVAGVTQETERPPEWVVQVEPDGSVWEIIRGKF